MTSPLVKFIVGFSELNMSLEQVEFNKQAMLAGSSGNTLQAAVSKMEGYLCRRPEKLDPIVEKATPGLK